MLEQIKTYRSINKASQESGLEKKVIISQAKHASEIFGISMREFCKYKLWNKSDTQIARSFLNKDRKSNQKNKKLTKIEKSTGKNEKTIKKEIKNINSAFMLKITAEHYFSYGFYMFDCLDSNSIKPTVEAYRKLIDLGKSIKNKFSQIDEDRLDYSDIAQEIDSYYLLTDNLISKGEQKTCYNRLKKCIDNLKKDSPEMKKYAVDMLVSKELLGFTYGEYISYHFFEKGLEEKREFINSKERAVAIKLLNSSEVMDILDNKYAAYTNLKEYYGRDMMLITGPKDYSKFEEFCKGKNAFVKKNNFDSLGRGVEKINIDETTNLKALMQRLCDEGFGPTLIEDLITSSEEIKKLNPDSVNTVRVIVYVNDKKPQIQYTFMKVGRAGSFVDNGGAGGIIVHINQDTGEFDSNGIDENGIVYEKHPDHGYTFIGVRMPDWDALLDRACEAALQIEGLGYVGWDFTYTSNQEWIIIEGNSNTQFIAQQGTINTGVKKSFYEAIDFWNRLEKQGK